MQLWHIVVLKMKMQIQAKTSSEKKEDREGNLANCQYVNRQEKRPLFDSFISGGSHLDSHGWPLDVP